MRSPDSHHIKIRCNTHDITSSGARFGAILFVKSSSEALASYYCHLIDNCPSGFSKQIPGFILFVMCYRKKLRLFDD